MQTDFSRFFKVLLLSSPFLLISRHPVQKSKFGTCAVTGYCSFNDQTEPSMSSHPWEKKLRAELFSYWQERILSRLLMSTESENRLSVWGNGDLKKSRGDGRQRGRGYKQPFEAAVAPSCRSSVSKIVIYHLDTLEYNQQASSKQQMTFIPRAKLLLFPMSILSWFNWANVIFAAYFILRALTHILIYCSYCFWSAWFFPLMQGHFSWALLKRKALHCGKISLSVKRQKMPCWRSEDLFTGDYSNQIACYVLA